MLALYFVPATEPGEGIEIASRRDEAMATAQARLHDLGADPNHYRTSVQMMSRYEPEAGRYLLEHTTLERFKRDPCNLLAHAGLAGTFLSQR
jgi:hypothetical protein